MSTRDGGQGESSRRPAPDQVIITGNLDWPITNGLDPYQPGLVAKVIEPPAPVVKPRGRQRAQRRPLTADDGSDEEPQ